MQTVGPLGALSARVTSWYCSDNTTFQNRSGSWGAGGQGQSDQEYSLFIVPEEGTSLLPVYKRMASNLNSSGRKKLNERYSLTKPISQSRPQSGSPQWVQDCPLGDISECYFWGVVPVTRI